MFSYDFKSVYRVECMGNGCSLYCLEDFALRVLAGRPDSTEKYKKLAFIAEIETHPKLRMCPGKDCPIVVMADREKAKKVTCETCGTVFWWVFLSLILEIFNFLASLQIFSVDIRAYYFNSLFSNF